MQYCSKKEVINLLVLAYACLWGDWDMCIVHLLLMFFEVAICNIALRKKAADVLILAQACQWRDWGTCIFVLCFMQYCSAKEQPPEPSPHMPLQCTGKTLRNGWCNVLMVFFWIVSTYNTVL